MTDFSFRETLNFFAAKLSIPPPEKDIQEGEAELVVDHLNILLKPGKLAGSLVIQIILGLLLQPIREEKLKELVTSNYLGVNTGGCKLCFNDIGVAIHLLAHTTSGTHPQENWEWLHRLLSIAHEWSHILASWEEFVPLSNLHKENKNNDTGTRNRQFRA
jgi:hypothetical protein